MKKIKKIALLFFPFFFVAIIILACGGSGGKSSSEKTSSDEQTIINNAMYILSEQLIDPSGATLNSAEIVEKDDYDRYLVCLDVTTITKIGGRDRKKYYVVYRKVGERFEYKKYGLAINEASEVVKRINNWGEDPDNLN